MGKPLLVMQEHKTRYGLWAAHILEVQSSPAITPLPSPLPYFDGVANHKGSIIPVLSLARISGNPESQQGEDKVLVIIQHPKGLLGLSVSQVLYVTEDTDARIACDNMKLDNGILQISEVIRSEEPVFVLDLERILE